MITILPDAFKNIKTVDITLGPVSTTSEAQLHLRDDTVVYFRTDRQGASIRIFKNDVRVFLSELRHGREGK